MTDFTPGPWYMFEGEGPKNGALAVEATLGSPDGTPADEEEDTWICGAWGEVNDVDRANVRLMTAAPEMYAVISAKLLVHTNEN